jgi:pimeloyl-ACP methyl ester carboxylesterase
VTGLPIEEDRPGSVEEDMEELRDWLTEDLFGNDKSIIYLQRPFLSPANSPINNAREIGDRKWAGREKCKERRALIEEAQEVGAKGRTNLSSLRASAANRDKLPPSRNILVAHSMGGVASREYVQGNNYNKDVDKVIALDSPHEGTGALNMLLEMSDWEKRSEPFEFNPLTLSLFFATGLTIATTAKDKFEALIGLFSIAPTLTANIFTYGLGQGLVKALDKHYIPSDSLVPYIDPNRSGSDVDGIGNLKNRPYTDSLPMMRLLYGTNSMKMI